MLIKIYIQKYYHLQSSNKRTRKIKNQKNQKDKSNIQINQLQEEENHYHCIQKQKRLLLFLLLERKQKINKKC